jgi:hypothetical protein
MTKIYIREHTTHQFLITIVILTTGRIQKDDEMKNNNKRTFKYKIKNIRMQALTSKNDPSMGL